MNSSLSNTDMLLPSHTDAVAPAPTAQAVLIDARLETAQAMASAGRTEEALALYADIGATESARYYQDALVMEQRGAVPGALDALKKSLSANPENTEALLKLAQLTSGAAAEKALLKILQVTPGHLQASLHLGELLRNAFRFNEAADWLLKAIAHHHGNTALHLALAHVYLRQADFVAAEPQFRRCIELSPGDLGAYQGLLDMLDRLDRVVEAENLCRTYLSHSPPNVFIVVQLAQSLVRQQRWLEAEHLFQQILTALPDSVEIRQQYADMLEKCGRGEEALAIHVKNVQMAPANPNCHLQLADIQQNLGHKAAATETLSHITRMFAREGSWGMHAVPNTVSSRLIFNQLPQIAERHCTGTGALLDNTGLDLQQSYATGEIVEMFCMVVGQEHIDFLEHLAYPAMLATDGFDALLRERTVVYNIYTTPNDLKLLQGFLEKLKARGIAYRINVEILSLSQDLYSILCLPVIDQVKRALALRSVVVSALPDLIISGSLAQVIRDMKPDETVVCAMPRIDSNIAFPALRAELERGPLHTRNFVRLCMTDFLHPQTYSALKNQSNCLQYRDTGTYYEARNWAPPPLCFYARPEMLDAMLRAPLCGPNSNASFYAIDHDFVESAHQSGKLRLIPDSDYFFWAELTHPQRHIDFLSGRKSEDYYYPEASKYIYSQGFKWIYTDRAIATMRKI